MMRCDIPPFVQFSQVLETRRIPWVSIRQIQCEAKAFEVFPQLRILILCRRRPRTPIGCRWKRVPDSANGEMPSERDQIARMPDLIRRRADATKT